MTERAAAWDRLRELVNALELERDTAYQRGLRDGLRQGREEVERLRSSLARATEIGKEGWNGGFDHVIEENARLRARNVKLVGALEAIGEATGFYEADPANDNPDDDEAGMVCIACGQRIKGRIVDGHDDGCPLAALDALEETTP